jgi:tRNA modification GTPase
MQHHGPVETIVAQATPPGRGGVAIVRLSGPACGGIAQAVLGKHPHPRHADYLPFHDCDKNIVDYGIALYFTAPNSFTGEDVLELHCHGGPVVVDLLIQSCLQLGARLAEPGEFSRRAFLNDKLDLAQAESIVDLINSSSEQAARSAVKSLSGDFSKLIHAFVERLIEARLFVESAIDFPEEEIDFLADSDIEQKISALINDLESVLQRAQQGCVLNEGIRIVILGKPNAGKSSLLNMLAQKDAAIVTEIPGTTRDVLSEQIHIDGMPVHIIDTAGIREQADKVEQEGIKRAWREVEQADRVLLLVDDQEGLGAEHANLLATMPKNKPLTVVMNKIDLTGRKPGLSEHQYGPLVALSAKSGAGLDLLREHLKQVAGYSSGEGTFTARRRHIHALERALASVKMGYRQLVESRAGELLAEELRQAQTALNEITGEFDNEDLLGRIFSSFCIGK